MISSAAKAGPGTADKQIDKMTAAIPHLRVGEGRFGFNADVVIVFIAGD